MIFNRIGADKHKFKGFIRFLKIKSPTTQKGLNFKIKLIRGSHSIEVYSLPCRKGTAKFQDEIFTIPLTLFYDTSDKKSKYLQKQAQIKVYEYNTESKHSQKLCDKQFDFSQFANQSQNYHDKVVMKLTEDKKNQIILEFELKLQRQDDDSKSVETYSSNNEMKSKSPSINLKHREKNHSSTKRKPGTQGYVTPKNPPKIQTPNPKIQLKTPENNKTEKQQETQQFFNEQNQKSKQLQQIEQAREALEQSTVLAPQPKQSPNLQIFLLQKALKEKQSTISMLKKKNENQQKSIEKLIEQATQNKTKDEWQALGSKEADQMKEKMIKQNLQIDELETKIKFLTQREKQFEASLLKEKKISNEYKNKLVNLKYRLAYMMQQGFEGGEEAAVLLMAKYLSVE